MTPQATDIQTLLVTRGECVVNDHVAFRTFDVKGYDLATVSNILASIGYKAFDSYTFPDKMLRANAYIVPGDSRAPKIFFSELIRSELDDESRSIIDEIIAPLEGELTLADLTGSYPFAKPTAGQYKKLADISEYAGWLSTMGYQANHFTVSVNSLRTLGSIEEVIELLIEQNYHLNEVGGYIKGTQKDLLVQASTLADRIHFEFSDGLVSDVPSCFYELRTDLMTQTDNSFRGLCRIMPTRFLRALTGSRE